jgi:hypothetical protein
MVGYMLGNRNETGLIFGAVFGSDSPVGSVQKNGPPGAVTPDGPIERGLGRPIKRSRV